MEQRTGTNWSTWGPVGLVLLVLGLGTFWLQRSLVTSIPGSRGSTYSRNTLGASGLYALSGTLDLAPRRRFTPFVDPIPDSVAQVWLLQPAEPLAVGEGATLEAWVRDGGTLILAANDDVLVGLPSVSGGMTTQHESITQFLQGAKFANPEVATPDADDTGIEVALAPLRTAAPHRVPVELAATPAHPSVLADPLADGLSELPALARAVGDDWRVAVLAPRRPGDPLPLRSIWTTPEGVVLADHPMGLGRIIVCTQPAWMSNGLLLSAPFRALATRLLAARTREGSTLFSEYHHGYRGPLRSPIDLAHHPLGAAVLWLLLVLGLGVVSASWRFVAVPETLSAPPPDSAAYAQALGHLYARAGAREQIAYNLAAFYQRQARRVAGSRAGQQRARQLAQSLPGASQASEATLLDLLRKEPRSPL
ncbi:MAG: DUF4350 domain-containing protein [bacterium]